MTDDLKEKLKKAVIESSKKSNKRTVTKSPKRTRRKSAKPESSTIMIVNGNGNVQVAGDYNVTTTKAPDIKVMPPQESIGADPLLKQRIMTLFNKIGEEREKRFGKKAYQVMYGKFKSDFDIKNNPWTIIWTWPKACAPDIINYLEGKYNNTIKGKIEKAASRKGYVHTRPQLYKKEKELLAHLGLQMNSPEVRQLLKEFFGTTSHTKITHLEHWQFVSYLEGVVKQIEEF